MATLLGSCENHITEDQKCHTFYVIKQDKRHRNQKKPQQATADERNLDVWRLD